MSYPTMVPVEQRFDAPAVDDTVAAVRQQLGEFSMTARLEPGARVAVTAGSRGINDLVAITRTVVEWLREAGCQPFLLPAMGSHGGATAAGQKEVLAGYGITPESMGAPVESTMDVVQVGSLESGEPVLLNRLAMEADGVFLINRVKPHTAFRGRFESGLMKMMTIGLGSHRGATIAHSRGPQGLARLIPLWGHAILEAAPIIGGLALLENAYERTAAVEVLPPDAFETREPELLERARVLMPRLLVRDIDLLIVERMGKDISGTGMDTNIIGRMWLPGVPEPEEPGVKRIVVLDLTDRTHGNANGVGLADIITQRLYDRIDFPATYANALTTTFLNRANIPVTMGTDQEAIDTALDVLRLEDTAQARVVRIPSTLDISRIQVSAALLQSHGPDPRVRACGDPKPLSFTEAGALL